MSMNTIDRCNDLIAENSALKQKSDELAAQVEVMRDALTESRRIVAEDFNDLGPCDHSVGMCYCDMQRSISNSDDALALPNTAADILRLRDARTLLEMAEKLEDYYATGGAAIDAVVMVRKAANKLDRG